MTEAQIQLQNALTVTFLNNISFLSEYDHELYQRVDELSRMIEQGTYKEKYALEFIMQDGDFDIYDIVNDKYLYNKTPTKENNKLVKEIEFDKKNSIFNIEETFTINTNFDINIENKFNLYSIEQSCALTNNQMNEYQKITNDFLKDDKKKLKRVDKLIFAGTLLGRHIPRIANKVNAKLYFVFEKNLEIFRLSLFTVDYKILANSGVIFSIMDNETIEKQKIELFCKIYEQDNYLVKVSTTNINIEKFIDKVLSYLVNDKSSVYDYNRQLYVYLNRTTKYLKENYNFLDFNKINSNLSFFENKSILFLAGGPSLDENIKWIQENQNKFFIVTIGAVYSKLLNNNIKVDLITTFDEQLEILENKQFSDENIKNIPKDTIILASSMTHENIIKKFNKENLFLYEVFHTIINNNISFSGPSVGEITLDILLKMNAKEIYLIGLDLAINQNTGLTHSNSSNSGIENFDLSLEQNRKTFALREGLIKVKGNILDEVYTTAIFNSSIDFLNKNILSNIQSDINIYNISYHGAYLNYTIPTTIESINLHEISLETQNLLPLLIDSSVKELDIKSKENIKNILDSIDNFILKQILEIEKSEIKSFDEFLIFSIDFINTIQKYENSILFNILANYYKFIFPYLNYHFNDIKIKNEHKKLRNIKMIFTNQIKIFIDDYKVCLERLIK